MYDVYYDDIDIESFDHVRSDREALKYVDSRYASGKELKVTHYDRRTKVLRTVDLFQKQPDARSIARKGCSDDFGFSNSPAE